MLNEKIIDINPILAVAKKKKYILESTIECKLKMLVVQMVVVYQFAKHLQKK